MNDPHSAEDHKKMPDGLARVVRAPTLLEWLDQQARKAINSGGMESAPAVGWILLDDSPQHRNQLGFRGLDRLMHAIHERIRVQLDPSDLSARFGLDAIGLVLETEDGRRDFQRVIAAVLKSINSSLFDLGEHSIAATVSIGIRPVPHTPRSPEFSLVQAANDTEQMSKQGGNRGHLCTQPQNGEDTDAPASMLSRLKRALRDDTLKVVFQPLLATTGAERERAQLLPRLIGHDGELIPAARFVPIAAERGLLPALDRWMIRQALTIIQARTRSTGQPPQYFLNQSAALIDDEKGIEWLHELLQDMPAPDTSLILEFRILELKPRLRRAREVLLRLQALGVGVSLAGVDETVPDAVLLEHLPADFLRMRPDFARRLLQDQGLAERFQKFTRLARAAGRQLIVPMLEDAEEVARIWQMDVDLIQGNFIQQPTEQPTDV